MNGWTVLFNGFFASWSGVFVEITQRLLVFKIGNIAVLVGVVVGLKSGWMFIAFNCTVVVDILSVYIIALVEFVFIRFVAFVVLVFNFIRTVC